MPIRLYYLANFFRRERPQAGRSREFWQFGVELYGSAGAEADASVILLAYNVFKDLGLKNVKLRINSIGCPECRPSYREALKKHFERNRDELCPTCKDRLETNPLRILDCKSPVCRKIAEGAPRTVDYLCDDCKAHFEKLKTLLDDCGISCEIDTNIVRGLDYYTKTVFEFINEASARRAPFAAAEDTTD
jgi:histidyl-tRNA synthetase